jgi:hypothetical protein
MDRFKGEEESEKKRGKENKIGIEREDLSHLSILFFF